MFNDTQDTRNLFIFDKDGLNPQNPVQNGRSGKPPGDERPGDEYFSISVEQILTMIAIEAASSRLLFRRAREKALAKAMAAVELFVFSFEHPESPEIKRELMAFQRYLQGLLRLRNNPVGF